MKLCIRNEGEIELNALMLIGASTKEGENKIGFFGSGNKYAMATLLRKGIPFLIYSGEKLIEVTTQRVEFGGQVFQQIVIDGQPTSLTTRMGPTWETWFAIREFYCNAVDEGGASWNIVEEIKPEARCTKIYIEATSDIMDFWQHRGNYILDGTEAPVWSLDSPLGKIEAYEPMPGEGEPEAKVFRKGVLVYSSNKKCAFWYNVEALEINESRVAQYDFQVFESIAHAMTQPTTKEYAQRLISAMHQYRFIENNAYWQYLGGEDSFSEAWAEALGMSTIIRKNEVDFLPPEEVASGIVLPEHMINNLQETFPGLNYRHNMNKDFDERPMTEQQQKWVDQAQKELAEFYPEDTHYTILFGDFKNESVMGVCTPSERTIKISIRHMAMGYDELCSTLFEELLHTKGFSDCSRNFEQYLMKNWLFERRKTRSFNEQTHAHSCGSLVPSDLIDESV